MKRSLLFLAILLAASSSFSKTWYVTPAGASGNAGDSYTAPLDILTALSKFAAGDLILLKPGTYPIKYTAGAKNTINCTKVGTSSAQYRIEGDGGRAVIDFQFPKGQWVQASYGLYMTGDYWTFKNITITHAGYQGVYVEGSHNTFENCVFYDNRNTGLEINNGGEYTTVLNCDAYYNYDPKKFGSMADGLGPKQLQGPGNVFIGCRAWENSDDGFDLFDSPQKVVMKNCWTFRNGIDVWNVGSSFAGNGNGFKVGGNGAAGNHELYNCVSFGHPSKGFDQNNNTGGVLIYNCTGYDNKAYNFAFGGTLASGQKNDFRNNLSFSGSVNTANATEKNNSWNLGVTMAASNFESVTTSLATVARNADGTLPYTSFLVPKAGSPAIDKGINVGLLFNGAAPDLGYYETGTSTITQYTLTIGAATNGSISPATGKYDEGTTVVLTATPASGYVFTGWGGAAAGTANPLAITMNANKTITATFAQAPKYTVATKVVGNGLIVPVLDGSYSAGEKITAAAIEYIGSEFTGWTGSIAQSAKALTATVTADATCTANFKTIAVANIYEFEDGNYLAGTAIFENTHAGFSGTGYVNTVNALGNWTELTVYALEAGEYSCNLTHAAITDRAVDVIINGANAVRITVLSSTSWDIWSNTAVVLNLVAGKNVLRFSSAAADGCPNLDKIAIQKKTAVPEQTIELKQGWNLVSLYVQPADVNIASIFPHAEMVKTNDAFWNKYLPAYLNRFSTIAPDQGYLIYNTMNETIRIKGTECLSAVPALRQGWNLIGNPYTTSKPVSDFFGTALPTVLVIKDFEGFYENAGTANSISTMEPGKAYFVKSQY